MKKIRRVLLTSIGAMILGVCTFFMTGITYAEDEVLPDIFIKAVNPGYTIDGKSNVGEMIELGRRNSDAPFLLAGATVGYTNSSGNYSILYEFPENSWMTGETLLLRLASSPTSELAAVNYTKTLAFKAQLDLRVSGEIVDEVCWTGKAGCHAEFKSSNPTVLVRNIETGLFEHLSVYEPIFDEKSYYVEHIEESEKTSQCKGLEFSEILSYYETLKSEQFIEIYNRSSEQILLDGCAIRYKNKSYSLSGILGAEKYLVYRPKEFSLTKNPTNSNILEILDVDERVVDRLVYPNGQRKGATYAFVGYDEKGEEIWRVTYAPTPGEPNNYQEYKTCEQGKVINKETGNCVKITTVAEKICKSGYYLNILTGRCRKIEEKATTTCKEGYYLNPETGRCRKIKDNTGANYNLAPENYEEKTSFIALYAVLGVIGVGLIYLVYEFRQEIVKLWRKVFQRFR